MTASRRPRRRPGRSPRDPTPGEMQRTVSLLEATLDSTADGILVVDAQGGVSNYNRRFLEMWRIPPEVAAARPDEGVVEFVLDQLANPDAFCNLTASNADDLVCTDGRVIERDSQPQRLGTEVVGRVWTFRDVTEHRRAERLLADREARLRVIVQSSPECVKLLGPDGTLLDMNPAGLAMIEAGTLDQVRGSPSSTWSSPSIRTRFASSCVACSAVRPAPWNSTSWGSRAPAVRSRPMRCRCATRMAR